MSQEQGQSQIATPPADEAAILKRKIYEETVAPLFSYPEMTLSAETMRSRRNLVIFSSIALLVFFFDIEITGFTIAPAQVRDISSQKILYLCALAIVYQFIVFSTRARQDYKLWRQKFFIWLGPNTEYLTATGNPKLIINAIFDEDDIAAYSLLILHRFWLVRKLSNLLCKLCLFSMKYLLGMTFWGMGTGMAESILLTPASSKGEDIASLSEDSPLASFHHVIEEHRKIRISRWFHLYNVEIFIPVIISIFALIIVITPASVSFIKTWLSTFITK